MSAWIVLLGRLVRPKLDLPSTAGLWQRLRAKDPESAERTHDALAERRFLHVSPVRSDSCSHGHLLNSLLNSSEIPLISAADSCPKFIHLN